jgi:hypothetical protein
LLDLLDRVLGKGVVAYGDIVLSIADLDLVYLNLRAVLSSIGTLESLDGVPEPAEGSQWAGTRKFLEGVETLRDVASQLSPPDDRAGHHAERGRRGSAGSAAARTAPTPTDMPFPGGTYTSPESSKAEASGLASSSQSHKEGKLELDPQKTAQGLAKLAMTLINLLRKLMERQAIRRMEAGTLTPEQLERAGQAFQRLDDQIKELCKQFGLKEEDLNLDLGPLGKLV